MKVFKKIEDYGLEQICETNKLDLKTVKRDINFFNKYTIIKLLDIFIFWPIYFCNVFINLKNKK